MEKTSHFVPKPSLKEESQQLLLDLNKLPVDMSEEPNDDVPPPLPFVIDLRSHNEDVEVLKQKDKVLGSSSSVANNDHLKNLGFQGGCQTMMCIRDKRVKIPGNYFRALGRSWFKEVAKKDEGVDSMVSLSESMCASKEGNRNKKKRKQDVFDRLAAKMLLKDFVMESKARASAIRKKGKKKVRFPCGPHDGKKKKKFVSKKRSLNGITIIDKEHDG